MLTDLEFRVWTQYLLSADDFGVMRNSAVTIQADNDHLANRPKKVIERCLQALCRAGLVYEFSHQGRSYVYQRDWQTFQKVEYPRPTFEPKPPEPELEHCEPRTQELFAKHPGGNANKKPKVSRDVPENSPKVSQTDPDYARGRGRETAKANGLRQTANGSEEISGRSKRPIFSGQRLTVFEWQLDDCMKTLGTFTEQFDLHEWFFDLDKRAVDTHLVIPKRDGGEWLQAQLVAEAQRRGLPLKMAVAETKANSEDAMWAEIARKGPSVRS